MPTARSGQEEGQRALATTGFRALGAFAAPAAGPAVVVLERSPAEPVWDELLLGLVPARPIAFLAAPGTEALPASMLGPVVLAAAGSAADQALRLAAATPDRIAGLVLVDPLAPPAEISTTIPLLVVRTPTTWEDLEEGTLPLPFGAARPAAVTAIRTALGAPPWTFHLT